MHIFVADEHPRQRQAAVRGAHEKSKPYGFSSRRDGARATWSLSDVSVAGAAQEDATLRNRRMTIVEASDCPASAEEGPATSSGLPTRRAAIISDGALLFTCSAAHSTGGRQVTSLTLRENAYAIMCRCFDKRPSRGFVVFRSADERSNNPHHFESELASRTRHASSGQGHHSGGSAD